MTTKRNRAFSMIELSIIVIIIGVLIAAVSAGQDLYYKSKISASQTITRTFRDLNMTGIRLWLDAGNLESLNTESTRPSQGDSIAAWEDVSLDFSSSTRVSYVPGTSPTYEEEGIGGLPSIKFNGTSQYLTAGAILDAGDDQYSIAAVFQAASVGNHKAYWTQLGAVDGAFLEFSLNGINDDGFAYLTGVNNTDRWAYFGQYNVGSPNYVLYNRKLDSIHLYTNTGLEGATLGTDYETVANAQTTLGAGNTFIGSSSATPHKPFHGLISEIIVFDRTLGTDEIELVRDYFIKKYGF